MRTSAGILLYRSAPGGLEVLIGHMGGPFWAKKDDGAWSIPKGEYGPGEDPFAVALREFEEELGRPSPRRTSCPSASCGRPAARCSPSGRPRETSTPSRCVSNTFELEWPPRSGRLQQFPEIDRAAWLSLEEARRSW